MVKQAIEKQIGKIEYREKKIFWLIFSAFAFFMILYGYLINSTMMNAISRQSMEKEMISLDSEVNSMEFRYLSLKNAITLEFAESKGFVSVTSDKFAVINPASKKLSLSINEN